MSSLTTHILDTMHGTPAAGVTVELYALAKNAGEGRSLLKTIQTNGDGRSPGVIAQGKALPGGFYELVFHVGAYFAARGVAGGDPPFLDQVPVRFGVLDGDQHYHVPLLISPYGYSTYRGS